MTIEHNTITDPNIHEPKGVAAASNGQVYIANGAGSGTWAGVKQTLDFGWEFSRDDSTQVITTTAQRLSINGLGANTTSTYLPSSISGSSNLWNTSTDFLEPIAVGDVYMVRVELPVTAVTGSPSYIELQVDIGGGSSPSNVILSRALSLYKAAPVSLSAAFPIFVTSTSLANGIQFFVSVDASTNATVTSQNIFIQRTFNGSLL